MSGSIEPSQLTLALDADETDLERFERLDRTICEYVAGVNERIDYWRSTDPDCIDYWYAQTDTSTRALMMLGLDCDIDVCKSPVRKKFAKSLKRRLEGLGDLIDVLDRSGERLPPHAAT